MVRYRPHLFSLLKHRIVHLWHHSLWEHNSSHIPPRPYNTLSLLHLLTRAQTSTCNLFHPSTNQAASTVPSLEPIFRSCPQTKPPCHPLPRVRQCSIHQYRYTAPAVDVCRYSERVSPAQSASAVYARIASTHSSRKYLAAGW